MKLNRTIRRSLYVALLLACGVLCASGQTASSTVKKKPATATSAKVKSSSSKAKPTTSKSHTTSKPSSSKAKVTSKSKQASKPGSVYRTGHGDHGIGTIKAPPRYVAPLPAVVPEPAPLVPAVAGAAAIDFASNLNSFFTHLQALETGDRTQTVRVLQFGDSHTAADMLTGRMRSLFQARFGNGGAGFSYAGHPFAGYRILGTSRSQSAGWITEGVHFTQIVNTDLGLGGVANTSHRAGESLVLDAPCTRMELDYLDQPGGGEFTLSQDGEVQPPLSTDSAANTTGGAGPETVSEPCTPGVIHHFEVTSQTGGPVRLLGFVTEQPGITYEALGLNGAEASLMLRWNQPIFTEYLRQRDPALIVLAYGTNEAGNHNWTYEAYKSLMGRLIDTLHATVPDASILVIGPPDRSVRTGRGRRASWRTFTETLHITDAQRDACRTHGCAFWSWRDRMGGLGSMNRWAADGLGQGDRTHFTSSGYVKLADFLYSDMIAAYTAWKTAPAVTVGRLRTSSTHHPTAR